MLDSRLRHVLPRASVLDVNTWSCPPLHALRLRDNIVQIEIEFDIMIEIKIKNENKHEI